MPDADENARRMAALVARTWRDPDFAALLQSDPRAALADTDFNLPGEEVELAFHLDTPTTRHFVIPPSPQRRDLTEQDLEELASTAVANQLVLPTIQ
jgi:hypothetical protein